MRQGRTSVIGAGLVLSLLAGMAGLTWLLASWTRDAWRAIDGEPVVGVDAALGVVAAGAGTALAGWLLVSASWCTLSVLRGLRAPALTPRLLRRAVVLLLGVGLTAAATPGYAAGTPQAPPAATAAGPGWQPTEPAPVFRLSPPAPADSGGGTGTPWVPSPPPGAATPESGEDATEPAPEEPGTEVEVAPGDTLWAIAARDLGPGADDAQIARAWPAWHATNLETIGPDPDRIFPGQRLRPPA